MLQYSKNKSRSFLLRLNSKFFLLYELFIFLFHLLLVHDFYHKVQKIYRVIFEGIFKMFSKDLFPISLIVHKNNSEFGSLIIIYFKMRH